MLHAASSHASSRGFGFSDMTERHTAWVLSRLAMELYRYPTMSEPVTLYTWIDEVGRLFTQRCFEMLDTEGKTIAYARSIWAAIDMQTRRMTPLDVEGLSKYIAMRPCPIEKPGKIAPIENETDGEPYKVKYSDLDINGHFNSIKYIEHFVDAFPLDMFKSREIRRFEISYLLEGRYGMPLMLHKKETGEHEYSLAFCHENKAVCRAKAVWT
jgi:acyl-ACP thioesterase